jgi:uncharacterized protein
MKRNPTMCALNLFRLGCPLAHEHFRYRLALVAEQVIAIFMLRWMVGLATIACTGFSFVGSMHGIAQDSIAFARPSLASSSFTEGFWHDRVLAVQRGSIPSMSRIMRGVEHSQFLANFQIASGALQGKHRGPAWNDGDCYKWIETLASIFAIDKADNLNEIMDEAIAVIAAAQREDGYLHTPVLINNRQGDFTSVPFAESAQFELYNMGHLMTAACVHHESTEKDNLLQVAIRAADFLIDTYYGPNPPLARSAICPSHYMGLIDLGRVTKNQKYFDLVRFLILRRDRVLDGTDDNQDRVPFLEQTQAVGHAVRANYLYAGVADLLIEEQDPLWLEVVEKVWQDVHERKIYITGACGALFDGASPDGSAKQTHISRTHQAYGRPYQLPNSTAHNESCASVGNILWNHRMLQLTGHCKYADSMERALYNALLAAVSLDGTKYFYTNTLRQLDTMPVELRWSRERQEFIKCFCCPPNVIRTVAQVSRFAYGLGEKRLWVHFYGCNSFESITSSDQRIHISQKSNYPWDGTIILSIRQAPSDLFNISLRIPNWADEAKIRVNGNQVSEDAAPGSYCNLSRVWKSGDTIELELPMRVRLIEAHPLVEETRNQAAFQRGPIVYCLESVDLPAGKRLLDAHVSKRATFELQNNFESLGGATCIRVPLEFPSDTTEHRSLYRELVSDRFEKCSSLLIPYYAWGNRGKSEMSVWLPLAR